VTRPLAPASSRALRARAKAGLVGTGMWSRKRVGAAPALPPFYRCLERGDLCSFREGVDWVFNVRLTGSLFTLKQLGIGTRVCGPKKLSMRVFSREMPGASILSMNLLYLHTHDLGNWTAVDGRPVDTPHLDALAGASLRCAKAFANAPTCSPSRAALLTGQYAHSAGMLGLAHRGFSLKHPERHLGHLLQKHGYDTALAGIQHEFHGSQPESFPYRECFGCRGRAPGETVDAFQRNRDLETASAAEGWLDQRKSDTPFFLSVGFFQPHRPLPEADDDVSFSVDTPASLPDTDGVREDFRMLKSSIRRLDQACGRVIDALKRNGFWENTIIVFTTDHGIAFPEHKCTLKDSGCQVSLFLRHPGRPETHGKQLDGLVSHVDVLPTLMDWMGFETPDFVQGRSLEACLVQGREAFREEHFGEVNFHAAYQPMRSVRTLEYLYIEHFMPELCQPLANIDDCLSKDAWMAEGGHLRNARHELYDLREDPAQERNLACDPAYGKAKEELSMRLHEWMGETEDPLLGGPLRPPPAARVNTHESTSSHEPLYEESLA